MSPPPLSDAAHKVDHAVARLKDLHLLLLHETTTTAAAIAKQQPSVGTASSDGHSSSDFQNNSHFPPPNHHHHRRLVALPPRSFDNRRTNRLQQQTSNRRRIIESLQTNRPHQKPSPHDRLLHHKKKSQPISLVNNAMDRNVDVFVPQPHHIPHSRLSNASSSSTSLPEEETDSSPLLPSSIASSSSPQPSSSSSLQTSSVKLRLPGRISWQPYHQKGGSSSSSSMRSNVHGDATSSKERSKKMMLSVQTRPGNPNKPWHLSSSAMSSESTATVTSSTSMTNTTTSSSRSGDSDMVLQSKRNRHLAGRNLSSSKPASIREKQVQRKREPIFHREKSLLSSSSSSRRFSLPIPTANSSDSPQRKQKNRTPAPSSSTASKPRRFSLTMPPTARSLDSTALEAQRKQRDQISSSSSTAEGGEFDKAEKVSTEIDEKREAKAKPRLCPAPCLRPEAEKDAEAMEERMESSKRQPLLPLGCGSAAEDAIVVGKKTTSYRGKENCCSVWPKMGGCIGLSRTKSVSSRDPPSLTSFSAGQYTKRRPYRSRPNPSPCYLQYNVDSPLRNPELQKSKLYFV